MTKKVLVINSSINTDQADSSLLSKQFVAQLEQQLTDNEKLEVTVRNLATEELPHLGQEEMAAWMTPAEERSEDQTAIAAISDAYIAELQAADILVIGLPMYNFGIPSTLKAWIDRIARAGITFRYTEQGPEGLLTGKSAVIMATRGGKYAGTPADTQSQFIKNVLGFVGIEDVNFVYAEGLAMGEKDQAIEQATNDINVLTSQLIQAA